MISKWLIMFASMYCCIAISAPVSIPFKPGPTDKASYEIIDIDRVGSITKTIHRRTGTSGVSFTRTEINCLGQLFRVTGLAEDNLKSMKRVDGKWTEFGAGGIKHHLAIAACSHQV